MRTGARLAIAAGVLLAIYGLMLGVEAGFTEYVQRIILLWSVSRPGPDILSVVRYRPRPSSQSTTMRPTGRPSSQSRM